jgi:D-3-phosphoglycerate dehydrogenase
MKIVLAGIYPDGTLEKFQAALPDQEIVSVSDEAEFQKMTDAEAIILRIFTASAEIIHRNPKLKAILRWGAGFDSVDVDAAREQGVLVSTAAGVNAYAVAELAVGLMIAVGRCIYGYYRNIQEGCWDRNAYKDFNTTLKGKVVGLIGGGNIGRQVAERVQLFGAQVQYYDTFRLKPEQEEALRMHYVSIDEILETSDVVSLHVPLLDNTRHMISIGQLKKMKKSAILINTARGGLIDEAALEQALEQGRIAGVGLDCVEDEGGKASNLLAKHKNVVMTPHIGGTASDIGNAMVPRLVEQLKSLVETGDMPGVVNRSR